MHTIWPQFAWKKYKKNQHQELVLKFYKTKGNANRRNYAANNRDCENGSYFCPLPHFWECSKLASYSTKTKNKKSPVPVAKILCCAVLQEQHNFLSQMKNKGFAYFTHQGLILIHPRAHMHPLLWSRYSWLCLFPQKLRRENIRFFDVRDPTLWQGEWVHSKLKTPEITEVVLTWNFWKEIKMYEHMTFYNGEWVFDFMTKYDHTMFLGNKKRTCKNSKWY